MQIIELKSYEHLRKRKQLEKKIQNIVTNPAPNLARDLKHSLQQWIDIKPPTKETDE